MRVEKLSEGRLEEFKAYCYKYRYVHDESFLYDEDINNFEINEENPTYILIDDHKITGVLSLMFSELLKAGIELGQKNGLTNSMLVVNAENDQALSLYVKNGFVVDMAVNCLTLEV